MTSLALAIVIPFAAVGAVIAYMVTYIEYEKHKFPKSRLRRESLNAAIFTFIALLIIWLVAFYFFIGIVTQKQ